MAEWCTVTLNDKGEMPTQHQSRGWQKERKKDKSFGEEKKRDKSFGE